MKLQNLILSLLVLSLTVTRANSANADLSGYDIVWESPSSNPSESMPFGGGDIGGNIWVENGSIYFYLQQSGCFSDNGEYLKLGRWRVDLTPNPLERTTEFRQTLKLSDGYVIVDMANKDIKATFEIWVDILTKSVHVSLKGDKKMMMTVNYENWRTKPYQLLESNRGRFGAYSLEHYPGVLEKGLDNVEYSPEGITFYHRNTSTSISPNLMITQQGLEDYKDCITDRNSNLTFGGTVSGKNLVKLPASSGSFHDVPFESWGLKSSESSKNRHILITTCCCQAKALSDWTAMLRENRIAAEKASGKHDRNIKWWHDFWEKSYIITDPKHKESDIRAWQMGRNYQLMRYQLGCNYYGEYPSKFNGGNFTFDPVSVSSKHTHDPDWRQWGGDVFTAQNQRLLYWPLLKTGDFEAMKSQFNLYEWGLEGAKAKVKKNFGHNGAVYCEYAHSSGLDIPSAWGWESGTGRLRGEEIPFGDPRADATKGYNSLVEAGIMANPMISYHWESQVEHAYMMLEYNRFSGRSIDRYIPFIKNALVFFDEHYRLRNKMRSGAELDENGKIVFYPSSSCESYRGAKNPSDLISGIRASLKSLIALQSDSISDGDREYFMTYLNRVPEISFATDTVGRQIVLPAESYKKYQNEECPQFYPLFPFNQYALGDKEIEAFRNTWEAGRFIKDKIDSWHQDGIFYARMGLVDKAYAYNLRKLADSGRRFPTFWGPGHDWVPDHNWGGSGMIGLQEMLMQTVDDKILVLPAWPKGKDVCFKLHAPGQTQVEVNYIDGQITKLDVSPSSRKKDVVIGL